MVLTQMHQHLSIKMKLGTSSFAFVKLCPMVFFVSFRLTKCWKTWLQGEIGFIIITATQILQIKT